MPVSWEQTVIEIAAGNPTAARALQRLGIDHCHGGNLALGTACDWSKASLHTGVESAERRATARDSTVANNARVGDLTRHVHLEHSILLPRAIPTYRQPRAAVDSAR